MTNPPHQRTVRRAIIVTAALGSMAWSCGGDDTATRPPHRSHGGHPGVVTPGGADDIGDRSGSHRGVDDTPASTPPSADTVGVAPGWLVDRPCDVAPVYAADCYWFEVPERRDVADARMIRLWVAVIHHDVPDAAPTARIHLPGGPGFPASTGWVAGTIELDPRDSRTIVVVDDAAPGAANHSSPAPSSTRRSPPPHHTKTASPTITGWRRPAVIVSSPTVSTSTATTPSRAPPTSSNSGTPSASTSSSCAGSATAPAWAGDLPAGPRRNRRAPARQPGHHRASRTGQPDRPRRERDRPSRRRLRRPTGMCRQRIGPREPRHRRRPPRPAALPGAAVAHRRRVRPLRGVAGDVPLRPHPRTPDRAVRHRRRRQHHPRRPRRRIRPRRQPTRQLRRRHERSRASAPTKAPPSPPPTAPPAPPQASGRTCCSSSSPTVTPGTSPPSTADTSNTRQVTCPSSSCPADSTQPSHPPSSTKSRPSSPTPPSSPSPPADMPSTATTTASDRSPSPSPPTRQHHSTPPAPPHCRPRSNQSPRAVPAHSPWP